MADKGHNPDTVKRPGFGWGNTADLAFASNGKRTAAMIDIRLTKPALLMVSFQTVGANFSVVMEAEINTPRGAAPGSTIPAPGAIVMAQTLRITARALGGAGKVICMVAPWTGTPEERKDTDHE